MASALRLLARQPLLAGAFALFLALVTMPASARLSPCAGYPRQRVGCPPPQEPDKPTESQSAPALPADPSLEFILAPAYGNLFLTGSRRDYFHYNRPPTGTFPGLLLAARRDPRGFALQQLWWRNAGAAGEQGYLDLRQRANPITLRLWRNRAEFFGDPQASGGRFSERDDLRVRLHLEQSGPGPAADLFFWDQRVDVPAIARFQPQAGIDTRAPEVSLRAMLPLAGGQLYLEPRYLEVVNRATTREGDPPTACARRVPDSNSLCCGGFYARSLGCRASASAAFDRITSDVSGRGTATWNLLRLQANGQPGNSLFLDAFYRHQSVDLPFTETAYASGRGLAGLNLSLYPARGIRLRAGIFHEEIRRLVRADHNAAAPEERSAWLGGWLNGSLGRPGLWALNVRFRERDLRDAPPAQIPGLTDTATLYYTRDRGVDARLDGFLGRPVNAYLTYGWRERVNDQRHGRLTFHTATLGATARVSSRLSLTAEVTEQLWSGNRRALRREDGNPGELLPPRLFFSDGRILAATAIYQVAPRAALDFTYNMFRSAGGLSARDHLGVLQYRREVGRDFFYSVGYQFERFEDRRLGRRYTAFPILFQFGLRRQFR